MSEYFSFDVRLRGIEPPIWRRFLVRGSTTFQTFHEAIQDACGWENRHFGSFRDVESGRPIVNLPDEEFGHPDPQAKRAKLANYFSEDGPQECMYEYDSGDSWIHDITLIETVELDEEFQRRLLDGARDFPKEDCGGDLPPVLVPLPMLVRASFGV